MLETVRDAQDDDPRWQKQPSNSADYTWYLLDGSVEVAPGSTQGPGRLTRGEQFREPHT